MFYTGSENLPAMQELKLSDAFIAEVEKPQLELIVKVINLNSKENAELLNKTPDLKEYTEFVNVVKEFKLKYGNNGYDKAIRYCIKNNILKDYMASNAKESGELFGYAKNSPCECGRCILPNGKMHLVRIRMNANSNIKMRILDKEFEFKRMLIAEYDYDLDLKSP